MAIGDEGRKYKRAIMGYNQFNRGQLPVLPRVAGNHK